MMTRLDRAVKWALKQVLDAVLGLERRVRALEMRPGVPGADGLGFDDLDVGYDGERTVTLRFIRGEQKREYPVRFPVVIDRGPWRDGKTYERGDGVTWGGSFLIAQRDTAAKPETREAADDWRLAVKRGQNGKDGGASRSSPKEPVKLLG